MNEHSERLFLSLFFFGNKKDMMQGKLLIGCLRKGRSRLAVTHKSLDKAIKKSAFSKIHSAERLLELIVEQG